MLNCLRIIIYYTVNFFITWTDCSFLYTKQNNSVQMNDYVGFWINGNIVPELQAEAAIVAHVKATHRIIKFMEASDKEAAEAEQGAAADVPQDMSLSNLNYSAHSYSSSDTHSSSMELDGYH